jgi:acyl dehydratase
VSNLVAMAITINGADELQAKVGEHLGESPWLDITQDLVNQFADATGDHQWIHVDPERAKKESPFGGPIAHGYLTLSLAPRFLPQVVSVTGFAFGVNYGANKIRFPAPVPVGSRLRAGVDLVNVEDVGGGGVQATFQVTFEVEGTDKPACVAEVLYRYYP